jgi:hypothetical protein
MFMCLAISTPQAARRIAGVDLVATTTGAARELKR